MPTTPIKTLLLAGVRALTVFAVVAACHLGPQSALAQGAAADAKSGRHWAYVKPTSPALPKVKDTRWPRNDIDRFILARIEQEGLSPSPEADRAALIRRVSLDLTGLPPTLGQVKAFLSDTSDGAYERLVDQLLASPQYGERWARPWLDLARYADSNGFQRDGFRDLWAYRDWVIGAFNSDLPFDQFTVEQLAGDLLPKATLAQKIATGFHRCTTVNVEAGTDQEENRVNQVLDRVNTTATVWLGSTLECAQCHNHKYDPFSQREYYQMFAFFNNTEQETKFRDPKNTSSVDFTGPMMALPQPEKDRQRETLQAEIDQLSAQIAEREQAVAKIGTSDREDANTSAQWHPLEVSEFQSATGSIGKVLADNSVLVSGGKPDKDTYTVTVHTKLAGIGAVKLETLTDPTLPGQGPGRGDAERPNFILNSFKLEEASESDPNSGHPVHFVSAIADFSQKGWDVRGAIDDNPKSGWAINPQFHKPHHAIFVTEQRAGSEDGCVLTFTMEQNYGTGRTIGRFRLSALVGELKPASGGADSDPELKALKAKRDTASRSIKKLEPSQTLVMSEMAEPRATTIFVRGNFMDKGDPVKAGVPAVLHPLAAGGTDRLALARWLVSPENPLVARVTVNRWWAEFFGHGIVATLEDFGVKGEPPTHPELLDWMATQFMSRGWSMKSMHKLMVMSATYRQSSKVTPQLLERDDQNKLYARGPRFRMEAEMIRDNLLSAAGLLSLKSGGPPVKPFQPAGVWSVTGLVDNSYTTSDGDDRYRRGIYTIWRRSAPYPSFVNFDAQVRATCVVRRSRSNTPLQALTLLNDPVYVEAALSLARRALVETPGGDPAARIRAMFVSCLARAPKAVETSALLRLHDEELSRFAASPAAATSLIGDFSPPAGISASEFAAWYSVASALMNLDEMITKG